MFAIGCLVVVALRIMAMFVSWAVWRLVSRIYPGRSEAAAGGGGEGDGQGHDGSDKKLSGGADGHLKGAGGAGLDMLGHGDGNFRRGGGCGGGGSQGLGSSADPAGFPDEGTAFPE